MAIADFSHSASIMIKQLSAILRKGLTRINQENIGEGVDCDGGATPLEYRIEFNNLLRQSLLMISTEAALHFITDDSHSLRIQLFHKLFSLSPYLELIDFIHS